jgi:PTS system nitrogen regulatory IIA component
VLHRYLKAEHILFLQASTRDEVLGQMIQALDVPDRELLHQAILERERIVSTGIGLGVAIPHAKLKGYSDFFIGVGVLAGRGVEWNALDGCAVRLVFLIGGPEHQQREYLNILSHVTMAIKETDRRKKLFKAASTQEVVALFQGC